mgnify:CR=1 FL=1
MPQPVLSLAPPCLPNGGASRQYENVWLRATLTPHICDECGRVIEKGEHYERARGVWGHQFLRFKCCELCADLREYTARHVPGFCWEHGSVVRGSLDALRDVYGEKPGVWFGGARIAVRARILARPTLDEARRKRMVEEMTMPTLEELLGEMTCDSENRIGGSEPR